MLKEYSNVKVERSVHRLVKAYCAKAGISLADFYTKNAIKGLPLEHIPSTRKKKK